MVTKPIKDFTGQRFGKLTVIEQVENRTCDNGTSLIQWLCKCDCGNEIKVTSKSLRGGKKSCGCAKRTPRDLTGERFGHLVVLSQAEDYISPHGVVSHRWLCQCDCGNKTIVTASGLKSKEHRTKSCGCMHHPKTHGLTNAHIYNVWTNMKQRCNNPHHKAYKNYGARGITVCDEWSNSSEAFFKWAFDNGYSEGLELDRIDNNLGYFPENCRWITHKEQQLNKRNNRLVEYNGETKPLILWQQELGFDYHRINVRLLKGWDAKRAFETPVQIQKKKQEGD